MLVTIGHWPAKTSSKSFEQACTDYNFTQRFAFISKRGRVPVANRLTGTRRAKAS